MAPCSKWGQVTLSDSLWALSHGQRKISASPRLHWKTGLCSSLPGSNTPRTLFPPPLLLPLPWLSHVTEVTGRGEKGIKPKCFIKGGQRGNQTTTTEKCKWSYVGPGLMLPSAVFYHLAMTAIDYLTFSWREAVNQTVHQIARDDFRTV